MFEYVTKYCSDIVNTTKCNIAGCGKVKRVYRMFYLLKKHIFISFQLKIL